MKERLLNKLEVREWRTFLSAKKEMLKEGTCDSQKERWLIADFEIYFDVLRKSWEKYGKKFSLRAFLASRRLDDNLWREIREAQLEPAFARRRQERAFRNRKKTRVYH